MSDMRAIVTMTLEQLSAVKIGDNVTISEEAPMIDDVNWWVLGPASAVIALLCLAAMSRGRSGL